MCLLTFLPPGVQPDLDALYNGANVNNDGHGYAIIIPSNPPQLLVRRSQNFEQLVAQFSHERYLYPDGPALFHSRWGTGGANTKFNCHPFYLGGDKQTIVAHNGVLPTAMQPAKTDQRCDTRRAAEDIFTTFGDLSYFEARERLATAIGSNNKLVILTIDPKFAQWSYIINETSGIWQGNTWYSNYDFKAFILPATTPLDNYRERCISCKQDTVDSEYNTCWTCFTCQDCLDDADTCLCYSGHFTYQADDIPWWSDDDPIELERITA